MTNSGIDVIIKKICLKGELVMRRKLVSLVLSFCLISLCVVVSADDYLDYVYRMMEKAQNQLNSVLSEKNTRVFTGNGWEQVANPHAVNDAYEKVEYWKDKYNEYVINQQQLQEFLDSISNSDYSDYTSDYSSSSYNENTGSKKQLMDVRIINVDEKTYGDEDFYIEVDDYNKEVENPIVFSSITPEVIYVSNDGKAHINGSGRAEIFVQKAGNNIYADFVGKITIKVNKRKIKITNIDALNQKAEFDNVLDSDKGMINIDFSLVKCEVTNQLVNKDQRGEISNKNLEFCNFNLIGIKANEYELENNSITIDYSDKYFVTCHFTLNEKIITTETYFLGEYININTDTIFKVDNKYMNFVLNSDNSYFAGLYIGDEIVSNDLSYSFYIKKDITLTAKYIPKSGKGYLVKYITNCDVILPNSFVKDGEKLEIENLKRDDAEFLGWYTDEKLTKKVKQDYSINDTTILYAKWKEKNTDNKFVLQINKVDANVFGTIKRNDVAPITRNDRTMLPARFVAENLGAKVSWIEDDNKVVIDNNTTKIIIVVGSKTAYVNDKAVTLDVPAFTENNRTYTPVRFIAESLGTTVDWDESTQSVIITK